VLLPPALVRASEGQREYTPGATFRSDISTFCSVQTAHDFFFVILKSIALSTFAISLWLISRRTALQTSNSFRCGTPAYAPQDRGVCGASLPPIRTTSQHQLSGDFVCDISTVPAPFSSPLGVACRSVLSWPLSPLTARLSAQGSTCRSKA
jgi:hypothetical protein